MSRRDLRAEMWPDIVVARENPPSERIGFVHPGEDFEVSGWLAPVDGHLVLQEVTFRATADTELSIRHFRYRVSQLVTQTRLAARFGEGFVPPTHNKREWQARTEAIRQLAASQPVRRDRRSRGESFYREVALRYLQMLGEQGGDPRGVIRRLAETYGHEEETARGWVRKARNDFAFLSPASQGRGGAEPGPRLFHHPGGDR